MMIHSQQSFQSHSLALLELDKVCFPASHWDESVWMRLFSNLDLRIAVDMVQSSYGGYIAFSRVLEEAELLRIGVKPDFRREGIAHALTEQMISVLRD